MIEEYIDFHTHTTASDGDLTPNELIIQAKKNSIKALAITDHDTILGNKAITLSKKEKEGIIIIPGIELSAKVPHGRMHILGLGIDINNKQLNEKLDELHTRAYYYIMAIFALLKKDYQIVFDSSDIKQIFMKDTNVGRPDVAKLLVKYGYATSIKDAFDKYLTAINKKLIEFKKGLPKEECITLIKEAGGTPILAHPHSLELPNDVLFELLKELKLLGLEGIECFHSNHTKEQMTLYYKMAQELSLLPSCGSDYHGKTIKPDIEMGTGKNNNLKIKELVLLDKLLEKRIC